MGQQRTTAPSSARGLATRERILDAASELFYAHGIHATSADRIIERAGITKVTFYRHFRSKDDIIVAYLTRIGETELAGIAGIRATAAGAPEAAFDRLAEGLGSQICRAGFRGCAFINAAAEYADPDHPVRLFVAQHRLRLTEEFAGMLTEAGVDPVDAAVEEIMMLRDGAMVGGYLSDPDSVSSSLARAFRAVVGVR